MTDHTVTTIVDGYSGGGCLVCGNDYACSIYGGYQGINWPEYVDFNDPVPLGNIITGVEATIYGILCPGYGGTGNTTVRINTEDIGSGIQQGECACDSCYPLTITNHPYPNGLTGYNYGGTNQLHLLIDGVSCIAYVQLTFQYRLITITKTYTESIRIVFCIDQSRPGTE